MYEEIFSFLVMSIFPVLAVNAQDTYVVAGIEVMMGSNIKDGLCIAACQVMTGGCYNCDSLAECRVPDVSTLFLVLSVNPQTCNLFYRKFCHFSNLFNRYSCRFHSFG